MLARSLPITRIVLVASFILIALASPHSIFAQQTAAEAVAAAEAAYNAGDYATAIDLYEKLIRADVTGAEIDYNLGSAYFQAADLGRALLHFRRAQEIMPRDGEINRGLALVRALRVDIQGDETALLDNLAAFTAGSLTPAELGWLTLMGWLIWCVLLLLSIVRKPWRRRLRWALIAWGVVVMLGVVLFLGRLCVEAGRPSAVVTAFLTPVMSGPGQDYIEIFDLYSAAEMRVMETNGDWARVLLPDGRQGWVELSAIELV